LVRAAGIFEQRGVFGAVRPPTGDEDTMVHQLLREMQ